MDRQSRPPAPPDGARPALAGRYVIEELLGTGGMGVVFGGRDLRTGEPIAVKRLHTRFYHDPAMRLLMAHEVRAMARLRHPGVVRVIDFGFELGVPYVIMERVAGHPLSMFIEPPLEWPAIRALGLAILGTLAHAHAAGVVHLDLKPTNILVLAPDAVKIVDFGIARLTEGYEVGTALGDVRGEAPRAREGKERGVDAGKVLGSRSFMAPEQAAGEESLVGPAADLFAVGVTLYGLISAKLPFPKREVGAPLAELAALRPKPLVPRMPIPEEAPRLIEDLLAGDPLARGEFAADYARRLAAMDPGGRPVLPQLPRLRGTPIGAGDLGRVFDAPTGIWTGQLPPAPPPDRTDVMSPAEILALHAAPGGGSGVSATGPDSGSLHALSAASAAQLGAGSAAAARLARWGLFGVREPTIVGRAAEQRWLLKQAAPVLEERRARACFLRGARGAGKSRLARWLLQRLREDGSFLGLAAYEGRGGLGGGVRGAIQGFLRVRGASQQAIAARAMDRLGCSRVEAWALAAVLRPAEGGGGQRGAKETAATLAAALRSLARSRPVLLWIDDADASAGGGAYWLVQALLAADEVSPSPVLVVATEAGEPAHGAADGAASLQAHPAVAARTLAPLGEAAVASIIADLVPLDPATSRDLGRRAGGDLTYVMHALAHLVETEQLRRDGEQRAAPPLDLLPGSLSGLLGARLDAIAGRERREQAAAGRAPIGALIGEVLELVALLGRRVELALLRRAVVLARRADLEGVLDAAVERWLAAVLLREDGPAAVELSPLQLEEVLLERARRRPGFSGAQRAAAEAKRELARRGEAEPELRREIAGHLRAAGRPREAAEEALEAGRRARHQGHADAGLGYLAFAEECLRDAGASGVSASASAKDDALRSRVAVAITESLFRTGQGAAARARAAEAVAAARRSGDPEALALSLVAEGDVLRRTGAADQAVEQLLEAAEIARAHDLPDALGRASYSLGHLAYRRGDLDLADALVRDSAAAARRAGEPWTALWAAALGRAVALARGDLDGAVAGIDADRAEAEACGFPTLVAQMEQHLGELYIEHGEHARAHEHLSRAIPILVLVGDLNMMPQTLQAMIAALLGLGRAAEAEAAALRCLALGERLGAHDLRRTTTALRAHAAALAADWDALARHLGALDDGPEELRTMEGLFARSLYQAGALAYAAGRDDLGRRAYERALVHLRRFNAPEVATIEATLAP